MNHREFVEAYQAGLPVQVNRGLALQAVQGGHLSKPRTAAHHFWTWAWFLSFPVAALVWWLWSGWAALVVLIVGLLLPKAIKTSAMQSVLEEVLENALFYEVACHTGLICFPGSEKETDR